MSHRGLATAERRWADLEHVARIPTVAGVGPVDRLGKPPRRLEIDERRKHADRPPEPNAAANMSEQEGTAARI